MYIAQALAIAIATFIAFTGTAEAQLASTRSHPSIFQSPAPDARSPDEQSKAQALDIAAQSKSVTTDISTAALLLKTMAGPISPQFVKCDPRTLPGAREMEQVGHPVSPNDLVLGQQNRAVVANSIGMVATSDGTQCPALGKSLNLAPYFNQVQP